MFWIQLLVLLGFILVGAQLKGMGLGIMGALGTVIYVYVFDMAAGNPPIDVMLIILCVVTAAASLQVSGGMDYLVHIAEKIIRKKPASITFIGPVVTFFFTFLAGTAHISYSLLPIIAEVSAKTGIRPEKPLSIAVVASGFAIVACPISAATVAMLSELNTIEGNTYGLLNIVAIVLPACIIGLIAGAIVANMQGKNLADDMEYQEKLKNPEFRKMVEGSGEQQTEKTFSSEAKLSVWVFIAGVIAIMALGVVYPQHKTYFVEHLNMTMEKNIQLIMLSVVMINIALAKIKAPNIAKSSIFRAGTEAVVSIFGVVWMSNTFIHANEQTLTSALQGVVSNYSWVFAIALFFMSALMFSQASTVKAIMPLGVKLGLLQPSLIAMYPATAGIFFIPSYPTIIAAINFDKTGTTKVGKYLLNHSFMLPGLTMAIVTLLTSLTLSYFLY
jgi:anaerobic C4-dicarboxylate transporter DcuA